MPGNRPEVTITLDGKFDQLVAVDETGHSFSIPFSLNGLRVLRGILVAKELDGQSAGTRFATSAIPLQSQVDEFLKGQKLERENKKKKEEKEFLELW